MRQPVETTKNGRSHTALISADQSELLTYMRIVRRVEDLDAETLQAIRHAEVTADLDMAAGVDVGRRTPPWQ